MASSDLGISRLSRWRRNLPFHKKDGAIYKALNAEEQEYRVLLLYAGSGEDPIQAELRPTLFGRDQSLRYEAISYCWGDPNRTAKIQLNRKTVSAPASSAAALRCVRRPDRNRVVWIDALCINQSDLDERSQQVTMMADIYSKSTGNLIYLGEVNSFTERALDSIDRIMADINERTDNFRSLAGTPFGPRETVFEAYGVASVEIDEDSLLDFFSNDWFRRVWAFQEAALAPSNVCLIGHLHRQLLDSVRAVTWITFYFMSYSDELIDNRGVCCAWELCKLVDGAYGFYRTERKPMLDEILISSRRLLASEPRDHVYGVLGLWNQYQRIGKSQSLATLIPDYRKPVGQVFRDATRAALEETRELYLWRYIYHRDEAALSSNDSPSWVLDLSRGIDYAHAPVRFSQKVFKADSNRRFTRSTISPASLDLMALYGFCLDQVIDVASLLREGDWGEYKKVKDWALDAVATVRKSVEETTFEEIAMVLLAGHNIDLERATNEDTERFADLLQVLTNERRVPTHIRRISTSASNLERARARFWSQILDTCRNRRIFVTETGYIGVGPKLTRAGDCAVVLQGGRTPFVLRPHRDEYRLVGECYVQGVMQGEAMRRLVDSGNPDVEYRIR